MRALLLALLLLLPLPAIAQEAASLVATGSASRRKAPSAPKATWSPGMTATGSRLPPWPTTPRDRLTLEGPILIVAPDGTILTADTATLDPGFRNALLTGARLVLDRQMQLAAASISRVDGRYNALDQAAVTSCRVCAGRAPLWEIRASRVIHDEAERQLYFDNARLLIRGVPVFWLPSMRLPDPTLDRATGFLIPNIRTSNQLGFGLRFPYFFTFGPSRDLTLTPWLSPETRTMEFRYRQAFRTGDIQIDGALGRDTLRPDQWRGYLMADGAFDVGQDVILGFDIEAVSDEAYLFDYNVSDQDRLASRLTLTRVRADSLLTGELTYFETLREDESNRSLPPVIGALSWERRMTPVWGGTLTTESTLDGFLRPTTNPADLSRDMARAGLAAEWRGDAIFGPGLLTEAALRLSADAYTIADDPDAGGEVFRLIPQGAVTLRWPLIATGPAGTGTLLEPVASLGWAGLIGGDVPNEDSRLVEFDEGNLLALTRFPGNDAVEQGLRAALGLNWTRIGAEGAETTLTFGRVFRDEEADFTATSGLSGLASDWLVAGHVALPGGFRLDGRTLIGDTFDIGRTEGRLDWANARLTLGAAYVYLPPDNAEQRPLAASEWTFDGVLRIDDRWVIRADARYDVALGEPARAGLGIGWRNECVTVDLSVDRRYTSSTFVEPSTTFGLTVNLNGFSTGRTAGPVAGSCG